MEGGRWSLGGQLGGPAESARRRRQEGGHGSLGREQGFDAQCQADAGRANRRHPPFCGRHRAG
eukprot:448022-Pyramimonas_sp.AAC.1